jgi:hypothetical protein
LLDHIGRNIVLKDIHDLPLFFVPALTSLFPNDQLANDENYQERKKENRLQSGLPTGTQKFFKLSFSTILPSWVWNAQKSLLRDTLSLHRFVERSKKNY